MANIRRENLGPICNPASCRGISVFSTVISDFTWHLWYLIKGVFELICMYYTTEVS